MNHAIASETESFRAKILERESANVETFGLKLGILLIDANDLLWRVDGLETWLCDRTTRVGLIPVDLAGEAPTHRWALNTPLWFLEESYRR